MCYSLKFVITLSKKQNTLLPETCWSALLLTHARKLCQWKDRTMLKMPQIALSQSWWATTPPPNAVVCSLKNKDMRWQTEVARQLLPTFALDLNRDWFYSMTSGNSWLCRKFPATLTIWRQVHWNTNDIFTLSSFI